MRATRATLIHDAAFLAGLRDSVRTCGGVVGFLVDGAIVWREAPTTGYEFAEEWRREQAARRAREEDEEQAR